MKRALVLVALVLVVFNARCFAACTLEPCAKPVQKAQEAPCHHQAPAPAEQHDSDACNHPQFMSDEGMRIATPELAVSSFELAIAATLPPPMFRQVEEILVTNSPPPLQSPALSRAVLRI